MERIAPSPRLLVRYRVGARDWLKVAAGQFSQMPSLPVGVPGFESFGLATYGLQRSLQASLGIESALEDRLGVDVNLDASLFYQRLRLSDLQELAHSRSAPRPARAASRAKATASRSC